MAELEITDAKTKKAYTKGVGVPWEVCKKLCMLGACVRALPFVHEWDSIKHLFDIDKRGYADLGLKWQVRVKVKVHDYHIEFGKIKKQK